VLLKQSATPMPMVMDSNNAENDYAGLITSQTINVYNKDNDMYDHMFVYVKIRYNGKMSLTQQSFSEPFPVVGRLKARVYGRALIGNAGRISLGAWISVSCCYCVLSGRISASDSTLVQRNPTKCGVS